MLYLYHATDANNLESILRNGLLLNPPKHAFAETIGTEFLKDRIFLAVNADVAEAYAEVADECPENIVVLGIPLSELDETAICYDWNNRCEYCSDINSVVYLKAISPESISVVEDIEQEPYQDIESFRKTYLYQTILDTFDEEVESNLENRD